MNLALTSTNTSCPGATNGSLQVNVTGGVSPYSYYYYQDVSSGGNDTLVNVDAENGYGNFSSSGSNYFYTSYYSKSVIIPFLVRQLHLIILPTIPMIYQLQPQLHLIFGKSLKQKVDMTLLYGIPDDGGSNWQSIPSTNYNGMPVTIREQLPHLMKILTPIGVQQILILLIIGGKKKILI